MKRFVVMLALLCMAGVTNGSTAAVRPDHRDAAKAADVPLPADAARVIEQVTVCAHLSGEVGSGDPDRERELTDTATKLHCGDGIGLHVETIRRKYADEPAVRRALADALDDVEDNYGVTY